ncbi:hypothetical protein ASD22_07705 [Rhodanobacter sp. Root480]|nr:hypothetical protein ASD22_07705 [Rhodanobacter sp. Root480]
MPVSGWTILCDFDGTISVEDVIDSLLDRFGRPGWEVLEQNWRASRIGSCEGMAGQVDLLQMSRTQVEHADTFGQAIACGHHQYRHAGAATAQPAQHFAAVERGQAQVQYHHVVVVLAQRRIGEIAACGVIHGVAAMAQRRTDAFGDGAIVLGPEEFAWVTPQGGKPRTVSGRLKLRLILIYCLICTSRRARPEASVRSS